MGKLKRLKKIVIVGLVTLIVVPVGWIGPTIYKANVSANAVRGVHAKIKSLKSQRPHNVTPENWNITVNCTGNAFINLAPWDGESRHELVKLARAFDQKLAAGDNLRALQWIWNELETRNGAGPNYARHWKPVRAMNPDPINDAALGQLWGLGNCKSLDLNNTDVSDAGLGGLTGATNLEFLELSGTKVTDRGLSQLTQIPKLRGITLTGCAITGIGLADLKGVARLEELELDDTQISDEHLEGLSQLFTIERLNLANTAITDNSLPYVAKLTRLTELNLSRTQVIGPGLEHLTKLPTLAKLNLEGIQINGDGLQPLYRCTNLTWLALPPDLSNIEELRALRQAIPKCKVYTGRKYFK
jgi:Leucine-rich repeat (LRR) protein